MQEIERLICDNSGSYDTSILEKELYNIKKVLGDRYLLYKMLNKYKEEHSNISSEFNEEFKTLNMYNHMILNSVKSIKLDIPSEKTKDLLMESEREVLKNIKFTFQKLVREKEIKIRTYELLVKKIQEYIYKKDEWV